MPTVKVLRVFVASSNDVPDERERMGDLVDRLNRILDGVRLDLWRWEENLVPGLHPEGIQALIDPDLDQADIVVLIAHDRIGPGTLGELRRTLARWTANQRPELLAYFSNQPSTLDTVEACEDRKKVIQVRALLEPLNVVQRYDDLADFERRVQDHLRVHAKTIARKST